MAEHDSHGDEKEWISVQKKTFTKWTNNHLRKKGHPTLDIASPETQFDDGTNLMHVVNALYGNDIPKYNKNAKLRPQKLDNINLALKMVEDAHIKTNFLKNTHLADHDLKMILGMMWAIILDYAIKGISVEDMTAKEGLLLWVRKKTANYRDVDPPGVHNFSTSWKDGMAFCALIHRHMPHLIDYDSLDKKNAAQNLELAFSVAERELGIPRLLDVEDLTEIARPDERSIMTYISEYFHRFANQDMKENAARRVLKFMNFMKRIEAQEFDYERRSRELIDHCRATQQRFTEAKFGDSLEEAVQAYKDFKQFTTVDKPAKAGERMDVETLFAEIQTELYVNGRLPYVAPQEVNPDSLQSAFDDLSVAEKSYASAVRDNRFRFIKKEESKIPQEKLDEFTATFNHFDKNGNGVMDKAEFKAALSALGVPFKDDAAYSKVFQEVSQGQDTISKDQYIRYNMALAEDRDSPDQVRDSFRFLADSGDSVTVDQLKTPPLTDEDRAFLLSKLPQTANGTYDFAAYIDTVFAPKSA